MNMKNISWLYALVILLGLIVFVLSAWDVIFDQGRVVFMVGLYAVVVFAFAFFVISKSRKSSLEKKTVGEFEKTLGGKLYHFKCPNCCGIFAIKKSRHNDKKPFRMTCPDCGTVGLISSSPMYVEEEIPEKKSVNVNLKCDKCGEGVTIWAEGADLNSDVHVYSCPYCGVDEALSKA